MSSREAAEYCLDCHWETFDDIMGKLPILPPGSWQCDDVHPTTDVPCGIEDGYCAKDTCSLNCSSVCDGFVDCDLVSTVCSNANCEEALCESTASACFDAHCCEQGQNEGNNNNNNNNTTTGLLRQPGFQWEPALYLPAMAEPQTDMSFNESHMINHSAAARCHQNCTVDNAVSDSQCHNPACDFVFTGQMYSQDCGNPWISALPSNPMAPSNVDANVMMSNATFDAPLQYENFARFNPEGNPTSKMPCFQADGQQSCADEGFQHLGCYLRNSGDTRLVEFSKQQSQSRVHRHFHGQAHHHELIHHTAPCNTRKSVSPPTISSFIDSPPSLDRAISSALTSPTPPFKEETAANSHVCRWSCGKSTCNASFSCCGDLQQHLVTHHMQPIDGSKGHGYYCCWEGCHRPHEPFSQKSKLQGHFLTHSNCTLSLDDISEGTPARRLIDRTKQTKIILARCVEKRLRDRPPLNVTNVAIAARNRSNARNAVKHSLIAAS